MIDISFFEDECWAYTHIRHSLCNASPAPEYTFRHYGENIAQVSKQWLSLADVYEVDITDDQDDILLLASTVVIDMCCHEDND